MEDVEKFFRQLVKILSMEENDRSRQPIEIAEIYQSIMPYRRFRRTLGFDTNQDYEMTLLRLLAGEGGLASVDPIEAQEALTEEANAVNPNPAAFREYAAAKVYLNINAIQSVSDDRDPYAPPDHTTEEHAADIEERANDGFAPPTITPPVDAPVDSMTDLVPDTSSPEETHVPTGLPFVPDTVETVVPPPGLERGSSFATSESPTSVCQFCKRGIPRHRAVKFCPYCGKDISSRKCGACGAEVGPDWLFCVACGSKVKT